MEKDGFPRTNCVFPHRNTSFCWSKSAFSPHLRTCLAAPSFASRPFAVADAARAPRRRAPGGGRLPRGGAEGGSALGEIGVQHENKTVQNIAKSWKNSGKYLKFEEML